MCSDTLSSNSSDSSNEHYKCSNITQKTAPISSNWDAVLRDICHNYCSPYSVIYAIFKFLIHWMSDSLSHSTTATHSDSNSCKTALIQHLRLEDWRLYQSGLLGSAILPFTEMKITVTCCWTKKQAVALQWAIVWNSESKLGPNSRDCDARFPDDLWS